jgi:asparagine synthase (glutamine-hydrolysing)
MCGINGIIHHDLDDKIEIKIRQMNDAIIHRGPDDSGVFSETGEISIAMGMRRLSIIDLITGAQPMYNKDNSIVIVFNGEIYNFKSLKRSLEENGVSFHTNSDTEVILKMYETHGIESFSFLDGMFAFSIYDRNRNKVIIARDFFGEKPLYYYKTPSTFYWASELKSIINITDRHNLTISETGLNLYFQLTYIPAPYTIYENIFKLEPNTVLEYDLSTQKIKLASIKQPAEETDYTGISEKAAMKICFEKVFDSVVSRSVSDVPIGTFLSGGVDSSIVSWCLAKNSRQKINTFSIGFENKKFDESGKARTVANLIDSNHHEFIVGEKDLYEQIDRILLNFDEPFADSSALATYLVANKTSSLVKVALTGDGGDEVFGGYNKYYMGKINAGFTGILNPKIFLLLKKCILPLLKTSTDNRGIRFKLKKLINTIDYDENFYYKIISLGFSEVELKEILINFQQDTLIQSYKNKTGLPGKCLEDFRLIDKHISLEGDMLVKVDRTSMFTSLECRAPFLNRELWDFADQLPEHFLIRKTDKKHILKKAFEQYFPSNFFEKPKQGFGVPVGDWLRNSLNNDLSGYIIPDLLRKQHVFNEEQIRSLVLNHLSGKEDNTFKVWTFYCFQKWYYQTYLQY